jgi:hypothetical protein
MKKVFLFITVIALVLFYSSCDPRKEDYYSNNNDVVIINPILLNPKDTFNLGDTLKFYFEVPDSISFNGKKIKTNISNADFCSFNQGVSILDTSHSADYYRVFDAVCKQDAKIGYISPQWQLYLGKDGSTYKSFYYLIPKKSGIFILEENNYGLMYTDNALVRSNVHFDLGTINRHFEYFVNNVKPSRKNDLIQYLSDKGHNMPSELYVFYIK